uniref:Uncharacterized protein n=1 Tax=Cannabis sativa TaxID=3483 RepID=A0A803R6M3_CANSA
MKIASFPSFISTYRLTITFQETSLGLRISSNFLRASLIIQHFPYTSTSDVSNIILLPKPYFEVSA